MTTSTLLDRLQHVRSNGKGRWIACCPAHEDKSPSLSIRELDDGRILLHDFGGCDTGDVLGAIGLTVANLFPERIAHLAKGERPNHWHARKEAIDSIRRECFVIAVAGENIAAGVALSDDDRSRVAVAAQRIRIAVEMCR